MARALSRDRNGKDNVWESTGWRAGGRETLNGGQEAGQPQQTPDFSPNSFILRAERGCPRLLQSEVTTYLWS